FIRAMASGGITGTPDAEPAIENSHKPGARSNETPAASAAVAEIARARPVLKAVLLTDALISLLLSRLGPRSSVTHAKAGQNSAQPIQTCHSRSGQLLVFVLIAWKVRLGSDRVIRSRALKWLLTDTKPTGVALRSGRWVRPVM